MHRLKDKGLHQLLLYRFLNHYGYDKGEVTANAIIDDILTLIDDYFLVSSLDEDLHHIHYGQLVWMAVPVDEYPQRGKSIAATRMKPVVLSFLTDDDINHIAHGFDSASLRKKRLQRWVDEAFDQGALLTQLDLASLLGVCDAVVSKYVNEIQRSGCVLPTRGNIHDLSGAITHKREIITLYLEGFLTPDIAIKPSTVKKLSTVTSTIIIGWKSSGNTISLLWTIFPDYPDSLNVSFNSTSICCRKKSALPIIIKLHYIHHYPAKRKQALQRCSLPRDNRIHGSDRGQLCFH